MRLGLRSFAAFGVVIVVGGCGVTLIGSDTEDRPDATDAATEESSTANPVDAGAAEGEAAAAVDAGCPTCPLFEQVTALVATTDHAFVGYRQGVARCDAAGCERVAIAPAGGRVLAASGTDVIAITGTNLHTCTSGTAFGCSFVSTLPTVIGQDPPVSLVVRPERIWWTTQATQTLRGLGRADYSVKETLDVVRPGTPLTRSNTGVLYGASPGIFELTDGTNAGATRSTNAYANVARVAFEPGSGTMAVILPSGSVAQCVIGGSCMMQSMLEAAGASASEIAIGSTGVYWTSKIIGEVRKMPLGSVVITDVSKNVTSPGLVAVTSKNVFFVTGPHGADAYALHVAPL